MEKFTSVESFNIEVFKDKVTITYPHISLDSANEMIYFMGGHNERFVIFNFTETGEFSTNTKNQIVQMFEEVRHNYIEEYFGSTNLSILVNFIEQQYYFAKLAAENYEIDSVTLDINLLYSEPGS